MLAHVLDSARQLKPARIIVVVGHGADRVKQAHRPRRAAGGAAAAGRRWQGRRDPGAVWRCAAGAAGHAAAPAGRARFGRSGTDRGAGGLHRLRPHRA
ncbi:hypothetical protein G6F62_015506 [Rhizopus arrhizus]|nr:hypothetical protein G6F62_015506 [Rhizopus arrhizus]